MLAHIVGGSEPWPLWMTSALLIGGALGALFAPTRLHRACIAVAAVGLASTVLIYILLPSAPAAPPGLSLTIAGPPPGATITAPLVVRVCAAGFAVPGAGRLLSISIDGHQVAEVNADTAAVAVSPGHHTLQAELVTSAHRAYAPPVLTNENVVVGGYGAPAAPPRCPR